MTTCTPGICWSHKEVLGRRCERHLTKSSFKLSFCPLYFVTTLMFIRHKEVVLRGLLKRSMQLLRTLRVVKRFLVFLITCNVYIRGDLVQSFEMVKRVFFEKNLWEDEETFKTQFVSPEYALIHGLKWVWPWTNQNHIDRNKKCLNCTSPEMNLMTQWRSTFISTFCDLGYGDRMVWNCVIRQCIDSFIWLTFSCYSWC